MAQTRRPHPTSSAPSRWKGTLLADLAHDLSTPLTAVHGALELLLAGVPAPLGEEQQALVRDILTSTTDLRTLVKDIADLGAIESDRLLMAEDAVKIPPLAVAVVEAARSDAARRQLRVNLDADPAIAAVVCDPARIRQILAALLAYAVKAARTQSAIDVVVTASRSALRLEVRSAGIVLPSPPHSLFSDTLRRAPGVPKPYRGPGLGLPFIKRLVQACGGRVRASQRGGVATIGAVLPVRAARGTR